MPRWLLLLTIPLLAQDHGYTYYLSGSAADARTTTRPGFLLAGGGKDNAQAFRWLIQRSGGGDLVILRASGSDAYHPFAAELDPLDSAETIVFRSATAAHDPFVLERIRQADAIFLAGGDQWNYYRYWTGTPLAREVNAAIARGVPIGGTSAGLAVLGQYGFTAQHDSVTSATALANPLDKKIALAADLFRIPALACTITDSHFAQRDRLGRLLVFLARIQGDGQCPAVQGIGIDERTVVLLEPDGTARVVGEGAAYFLKLTARADLPRGAPARMPEVSAARVAAGGVFHLSDWHQQNSAGGYRLAVEQGRVVNRTHPKASPYHQP